MKREYQGLSLIHGGPFYLNAEALPTRFQIRDCRPRMMEAAAKDTLQSWFLLGGSAACLALLLWLGF